MKSGTETLEIKPPLGVEPRALHVEGRILALAEAIARHYRHGTEGEHRNPLVWAQELAERVEERQEIYRTEHFLPPEETE